MNSAGSEYSDSHSMTAFLDSDIPEAEMQGWYSPETSPATQVDEHSYGSAPLTHQVQTVQPSQLWREAPQYQQPVQQFQPQQISCELPILHDEAWNEYLQDAHLWQPGDPFATPRQPEQFDTGFVQPYGTYPQGRRGAICIPHLPRLQIPDHIPVPPTQPPRQLSAVEQQVYLEVIRRLNANGAGIDPDTLTIDAADKLFHQFASPAEHAAVLEDQTNHDFTPDGTHAYQPAEAPINPYQPAQAEPEPGPYQPVQVDQPDTTDTPTPTPTPSTPKSPTGKWPTAPRLHNKHNRLHLRKKCFPCFQGKRKCDRDPNGSGICSKCAHRADKFPQIFDAEACCVIEESEEFRQFKAERAFATNKVRLVGEGDWQERRQVRQDAEAREKEEKKNGK
ncbi:hypothetical protein PMZ80_000309 [Knufia obscura]|uniref:Zn(2)-C6 fungal-type domain-containing protein n=1 Tax=Knufia obscura TaxID=1635080 RepID=A0ABR0RZZ0_9EURO|nr:hypothetical protein PMZ80_000309 [Knufia obscura]